jgi:hypothetical protein
MTTVSSSRALGDAVARAVAKGSRVEFQNETTAVLVRGRRVNHVLHAIVSVFTLGIWLWIWLPMTIFGGEKRTTLTVDSNGAVNEAESKGSPAVKWVAAGVLGLIILGAVATLSSLSADSSSSDVYTSTASSSSVGSSGSAPKVSSQGLQRGTVGEVVHVGDLDLRIVSVDGFDSRRYNQFNSANVVVNLEATNARGKNSATYSFSPLIALTLVDGNGVGTTPTTCAGCPSNISTVELTKGGTITGNVYFKFASQSTSWKQVRYQALMSSNEAIITP